MTTGHVASWGNTLRVEHSLLELESRFAPFPDGEPRLPVLPFGNGRSYGDSCLNAGGALLRMRRLDRFIHFDRERGVLECEAGVLLDEILTLIASSGWFLPVTPGTRFVTVGGAIANDVHGKNHHRAGTFGRHVQSFELLRSDRGRLECSADRNPEWFAATIGGLGLTGVITSARIALRPVAGPWLDLETIRFGNLEEFLRLSGESDEDFEYTVAWIDCNGRGNGLGRGIFQRANHSSAAHEPRKLRRSAWDVRPMPPISLVNTATTHVFNALYYGRHPVGRKRHLIHYEPFFYPLDGVRNWNRLYGPRGFFQYQCVVPFGPARAALRALLEAIAQSRIPSFLSVLKAFGDAVSPGMMSFPCPGLTLAIDFPADPARTPRLFERLDAIVQEAGGRLYPAKDARMSADLFRSGYPRWREFAAFVDPRCSSSFWRRVAEAA